MFLRIRDEWGRVYATRNRLLTAKANGVDFYLREYGQDYERFLSSEEWKDYRKMCAFFEFIGVLLHTNQIKQHELFVMVTVDVFERVEGGERQTITEGVLYSKLKGPIEFLRQTYRKDIYFYYDQILLVKFRKRTLPRIPRRKYYFF